MLSWVLGIICITKVLKIVNTLMYFVFIFCGSASNKFVSKVNVFNATTVKLPFVQVCVGPDVNSVGSKTWPAFVGEELQQE